MRPDLDGHLHDLLHDAAREIPPDATVVPDLLQRLASEEHRMRSYQMRPIQRFIAPAIATILVVALVITFVAIHGVRTGDHVAKVPTSTPTATPVPAASFTPSTITQGGITIQFDHVEASALGIAVTYHFTTPLPHPGDQYTPENPTIVDDANIVHYPIGGTDYTYPQGYDGPAYATQSFAPLAPGPVKMHTLRFFIPGVITVGGSSSLPQLTKGTWNFTLHLVPAVSGTQKIQAASQKVGGISITPQSISWLTAGDPAKSGAVVRLVISGLPKVSDPVHSPLSFNEVYGVGNCTRNPPNHPIARYVFLSQAGQQQCADFFTLAAHTFDATQAMENINFTGSVNSDGTAVVDVGFNAISLTPGTSLKLLINELIVTDSYTPQHFTGPWSFTFTLGK
jgi:hypothetical protein